MVVKSTQISVATTGQTELFGPSVTRFSQNFGTVGDPTPVVFVNQDPTNPVYLGGPDVTTSGTDGGVELAPGNSIGLSIVEGDVWYGVATGAAVIVGVAAGRQ
jgi:hypothetical protein